MKRLLDYDPETGTRITFEDLGDDGFALHTEQDCEPVIEMNKAKQSMGRDYYAADKDMWKVASIPMAIQFKWLTEEGIDIYNPDHKEAVRRKLNDPDYRWLKTAEVII